MEAIIGLSPIILVIVLAVVIIRIIMFVLKKSSPNSDLEKRIRELEEEMRTLKSNRDN